MSPRNTILRLVGVLCALVFAATAFADPGNGNGDEAARAHGTDNVPPGQEKKADPQVGAAQVPAQAAPPAQARQTERQARQDAKPTPKPKPNAATKAKASAKANAKSNGRTAGKPAKEQKRQGPPAEELRGRSAEAHHHVIVCHRTGSESNPYVVINIPLTAWHEAHSPETGSHPDLNGRHDILLKDPASGPGTKDGFTKADCEAGEDDTVTATTTSEPVRTSEGCPPTITGEPELLGVWHATGAYRHGQRKYVFIRPNAASAHYSKHEDDIPVYATPSVVAAAGDACLAPRQAGGPTASSTSGDVVAQETPLAGMSAPRGTSKREAREKAQETRLAGAPVGARNDGKSAPKDEPTGGVLGAVASAPAAVARTVANETLPFTGIPLWIAALLGAGILLTGFALRRAH